MLIEPGRYEGVPAYTLLEAAAHGYLAVDYRFLHAILDNPDRALPDLVRFAAEDHENDRVNLELELIDMFQHIGTAEALPFFIDRVRRDPAEIRDELVEAFAQLGPAAVDPLLALLDQLDGQDPGDVPFLLAPLHVRDSRILEALVRRLAIDALDGALCLEIYGDAAAIPALEAALARIPPEDVRSRDQLQSVIRELSSPPANPSDTPDQFNIWDFYPEQEEPDYGELSDDERLAMLQSGSAKLRASSAETYAGYEPSADMAARLLELAQSDPEQSVRAACWEGLANVSDEPKIRTAMMGVLCSPEASMEEKAGAALALASNYDSNLTLIKAIEDLYADPRSRAKALQAMGYSLDRRFAGYPPRHLDDADPEIKRHAIMGVGYLNLSSDSPRLESLLREDEFRMDALFAYALSMPGETSPGRAKAMLKKVERVAGGFHDDEEELVKFALNKRLTLRGKRPAFSDI